MYRFGGKDLNFCDEFIESMKQAFSDELAYIICNTKAEKHLLEKIGYDMYKRKKMEADRIAARAHANTILRAYRFNCVHLMFLPQ